MAKSNVARDSEPVTLAEQLVGWARWRSGEPVQQVAVTLRRSPRAARRVLFGRP